VPAAPTERDVGPVVHHARRAGPGAQPGDPQREVVQLAVGAAVGPDLHDRRAGRQRGGNDLQRRPALARVGEHVQPAAHRR